MTYLKLQLNLFPNILFIQQEKIASILGIKNRLFDVKRNAKDPIFRSASDYIMHKNIIFSKCLMKKDICRRRISRNKYSKNTKILRSSNKRV